MSDPTEPTPPPAPPLVPQGAQVHSRHSPEWGKGMVIGREGRLLRVLFVAHPARKPVVVPPTSLVVDRAGNWPIASEMDPAAPAAEKRGAKKRAAAPKPPKQAARSREEALKAFVERFPAGLADPAYVSTERDYRWGGHLLWVELLGGGQLERLVEAGDARELVTRMFRVEAKVDKLLHAIERTRFKEAFTEDASALAYFQALAGLLASADPATAFPAYELALGGLPKPKGRVDVWTVATLLPYLAQPERFLFVKPKPTQEVAARYGVDLLYASKVSWTTYAQVVKLVEAIRQDLEPIGCRDLVDVQAFIALTQ